MIEKGCEIIWDKKKEYPEKLSTGPYSVMYSGTVKDSYDINYRIGVYEYFHPIGDDRTKWIPYISIYYLGEHDQPVTAIVSVNEQLAITDNLVRQPFFTKLKYVSTHR